MALYRPPLFMIAVFAALSASAPTIARAQDTPVLAGGGDSNLDACGDIGEVIGLNPHGDGFLSVRSGPGGRPFFEKDRVFNGQAITICEHRGNWFGVVYSQASRQDCGLSAPRQVRQPYTGPCRWGWVSARYVREIAGGINAPEAPLPAAARQGCEDLYAERNAIYKEAGYCFKTTRAIREFGNAGCRFDSIEDVPLSANDRRVAEDDARHERTLGCTP